MSDTIFKTQYIRANKQLYALPAAVQEQYFKEFDLEPEPLTAEHLKHIRNGLEEYLDKVEDRDLEFKVSNGVIREISVYALPTGSKGVIEDYLRDDDDEPKNFYDPEDAEPEDPGGIIEPIEDTSYDPL